MASLLYRYFHPTIDALFSPLPFTTRLRLAAFQPIAILTYLINTIPTFFMRQPVKASKITIPTRSGSVHALLYHPAPTTNPAPHPLHIDIHGGGFIGGQPLANHRFCTYLSRTTGALVISPTYRFAPRHPFPAAINDIDDVFTYLLKPEITARLNFNPHLITISGSSAGGNLALAACLAPSLHGDSPTAIKAAITFYAAIDLRIPASQKPKPANAPKRDPLSWMMPLYDAYSAPGRPRNLVDARCNPILAPVGKLPARISMCIAEMDILVKENLEFVERVNREIEELDVKWKGKGKGISKEYKVEGWIVQDSFHGWLEVPAWILRKVKLKKDGRDLEDARREVFERCGEVIREVHREGGWEWKG